MPGGTCDDRFARARFRSARRFLCTAAVGAWTLIRATLGLIFGHDHSPLVEEKGITPSRCARLNAAALIGDPQATYFVGWTLNSRHRNCVNKGEARHVVSLASDREAKPLSVTHLPAPLSSNRCGRPGSAPIRIETSGRRHKCAARHRTRVCLSRPPRHRRNSAC